MQRKHSRYTDQMQPSCMTRFVPWAPRFPFLSFVFTLNFAVSNSQASQVNEKARDSYMAAMDTYYKANQQADYGSFIILRFLSNYDQSRLLSSELKVEYLACFLCINFCAHLQKQTTTRSHWSSGITCTRSLNKQA